LHRVRGACSNQPSWSASSDAAASYEASVYSQRDGKKIRKTLSSLADAKGWRAAATVELRNKSLRGCRRAERTWIFGVDIRHEAAPLRFVFWAAAHHARPDDPLDPLTEDPVVLVSMEQQQEPTSDEGQRVYYHALDALDEGMVSLREVVTVKDGPARRRWNPRLASPRMGL
jgi:hypothetical protein